MDTYLGKIFNELKVYKTEDSVAPVTFNINGVSHWKDPLSSTRYFWCGGDFSGLACVLNSSTGTMIIHPYYCGRVLNGVDLFRSTDLHRPKGELAFVESLYKNALSIHKECIKVEFSSGACGSFEDYIPRLKRVLYWITYFNSTVHL